jgi:hypothetical protein
MSGPGFIAAFCLGWTMCFALFVPAMRTKRRTALVSLYVPFAVLLLANVSGCTGIHL